jgi:hypothetical protein
VILDNPMRLVSLKHEAVGQCIACADQAAHFITIIGLTVTYNERTILRDLVRRYMEICSKPEIEERRNL